MHFQLMNEHVTCTLTSCCYAYADESVLRDLKALLIEAKQKVPPFLHQLDSLSEDLLDLGGTV